VNVPLFFQKGPCIIAVDGGGGNNAVVSATIKSQQNKIMINSCRTCRALDLENHPFRTSLFSFLDVWTPTELFIRRKHIHSQTRWHAEKNIVHGATIKKAKCPTEEAAQ